MSRRSLGLGVAVLLAALSKVYERLPEFVQVLLIEIGIVVGFAIIGGYFYPDARVLAVRAWEQSTAAVGLVLGSVFIVGWYAYMKLRGRERQAQQAMAVFLIIVALAAIGKTQKAT